MRTFLALVLLSFNAIAGAVEWTDLTPGGVYRITQGAVLPVRGGQGRTVQVRPGDFYRLKQVEPLVSNVILFSFDIKNCPGPNLQSEMTILPVQGTNPVVEVGFQLEKSCQMWIFLEGKDTWTKSIFAK